MATQNVEIETNDLSTWIPNFCIDDFIKKAICFRENLIVHSRHGQCTNVFALGGYCISVEQSDDKRCEFIVHVSSTFTVRGQFGGSKLISSVNQNLSCLEEKRTEFLYASNGYHEKELSIISNKNCVYHVEVAKTCPCNSAKNILDVPLCCVDKLLCEGANIVLSRYLALRNFTGNFILQNLNEDGHIIQCEYSCSAAECKTLFGRCLNVYTVERKMISNCETHIVKTYFSTNGKILKHDWQSLPFVLEINPLLLSDISLHMSKWQDNLDSTSTYLENNDKKRDYFSDHPEIKTLILDYVQTLLAVKPAEILTFTLNHILNIAKNDEHTNSELVLERNTLKENMRRICNLCGISIDTKSSVFMETTSTDDPFCKTICGNCTSDVQDDCLCEQVSTKSDSNFDSDNLENKVSCEGCKVVDHTKLESCGKETDCTNTCEGCKIIKKLTLNPCQSSKDCVDTNKTCTNESEFEKCDVKIDCEEFCKSCLGSKLESTEACLKDCKEAMKEFPIKLEFESCKVKMNCEATCKGCEQSKLESAEAYVKEDSTETCDSCK